MDRSFGFVVLMFFFSSSVFAFESLPAKVDFYTTKYALFDPYIKRIDNSGLGDDHLFGTRNFRVVLNGVQYRGGGNNKYHPTNPRPNMSPLPDDGLENLCKEGFRTAIYLYSEGYSSAPKKIECQTRFDGRPNTLNYLQISPYNETDIKKIFTEILAGIRAPELGPVYTHCWNGWHASGLISALALRQFCDTSGEDAVAYWDRNTDGFNTEPSFEKLRTNIRNFKKIPSFSLTEDERTLICPKI